MSALQPSVSDGHLDIDIDDRRRDLLLEARQVEGDGRVINASYTKAEYTHRRHGYLSKHPEFRHLRGILPGIHLGAEDVFYQTGREDRLSAAEVRSRELELDISPVLPFATLTNTDTLDDFVIHEDFERALNHSSMRTFPASAPTNSLSTLQQTEVSPHFNNSPTSYIAIAETVSGVVASLRDNPGETSALSQAPFATSQTHHEKQTANLGMDFYVSDDGHPNSANTIPAQQITTSMQTAQSPDYGLTGLMPFEKFYSLQFQDTGEVTKNDPSPHTRDQTFAQLRQDLHSSDLYKTHNALPADQAPAQYYHGCGEVAAVANRAISTPVKPQGKKRSAPADVNDPSVTASVSNDDVLAPDSGVTPLSKRQKKAIPPSIDDDTITFHNDQDAVLNKGNAIETEIESDMATLPPVSPRPTSSARNGSRSIATKAPRAPPGVIATPDRVRAGPDPTPSPKAPEPKPAPKGKQTPGTTETPKLKPKLKLKNTPPKANLYPNSKPGVVSGDILPTSKTVAIDSAHTRRQLLIARREHSGKKASRNKDLPPEFFDVAKFSKQEREEIATGGDNAPVRCVCGEPNRTDLSGHWIACSERRCGVWQHVDCMGEAVPPESVRATANYKCQQCDPWGHRHLLRRLRSAQSL